MPRDSGRREHLRERIAHQAARLIAEDGIADFGAAKRKAARQLGASDARNLPTNEEVEEALRSYQSLYHADALRDRLRVLRTLARDSMRMFEKFRPNLVGGLVTGNIGKLASVHLHLFADSAKDVEMYLMNQRLHYATREVRLFLGSVEYRTPAFAIEAQDADVELSVLAAEHENRPMRTSADGRPLARASLSAVEALLAQEAAPQTGE